MLTCTAFYTFSNKSMSITRKLITFLLLSSIFSLTAQAVEKHPNVLNIPFQAGTLRLNIMADNAVRVQYIEEEGRTLPEWVYLPDADAKRIKYQSSSEEGVTTIETHAMSICIDNRAQVLTIANRQGNEIFKAQYRKNLPG